MPGGINAPRVQMEGEATLCNSPSILPTPGLKPTANSHHTQLVPPPTQVCSGADVRHWTSHIVSVPPTDPSVRERMMTLGSGQVWRR